MKIKVFIIWLFFGLHAHCQNDSVKIENNSSAKGLSDDELSYACKEYMNLIETDIYLEYEKNVRYNADKMKDAFNDKYLPLDSLKNDTLYLKWIEKNIKNTGFKSFEEAKTSFEKQIVSQEKMEKENPKLFELIERANTEQRHKIFQPLFNRSRKEMKNNH